jgi:hypothetical protein
MKAKGKTVYGTIMTRDEGTAIHYELLGYLRVDDEDFDHAVATNQITGFAAWSKAGIEAVFEYERKKSKAEREQHSESLETIDYDD